MEIINRFLQKSLAEITKKVAIGIIVLLAFSHAVRYGLDEFGLGGIKKPQDLWQYS